MNLRSRTRLIVLMTLLIIVVVCVAFLFVRLQKTPVEREMVQVNTLMADAIQLRGAIFDYLLHREIRPRLQAKLSDLHRLLENPAWLTADHPLHDAQSRILWNEVSRLLAECESLFTALVGREAAPVLSEHDQRTADLLLVSSQSLILTIGQIHHRVVSELLEAHSYEEMTLWTLLAGLTGLGITLFLLLRKGILVPLRQLHETVVHIADGQWDLRLHSPRRDEFGQLANAFDHMLDQLQETTVSRDRLAAVLVATDQRDFGLRSRSEDEFGQLSNTFDHMLDQLQETTVSRDRLEAEISERQRTEAEVHRLNAELEERVHRRTAELEAANQELESFAYAVSHDLRAPLRAMSGFSQALLEDYGERLDGEARVYLDQITLSSRHMSELIDGLLTLSRSTRGELRRDPVDITALAERLLAERAAAEPERQVIWRVESELRVRGDPVMLEVVMSNLIENAWKYTAKTPNATIRVYTEDQEGERCFCVADNGAGFDMAHANRLFKAFQRLHRQDEFPGIGIGLATVQRIIHRHGGAICAEGAPGCGATFRFTLPYAETPGKEIT